MSYQTEPYEGPQVTIVLNLNATSPTDKCCCGHPRSEHQSPPDTHCVSCANSVLISGEHPFGAHVFCRHFTQSYRIVDTDVFGIRNARTEETVIASGITYKPFADVMCEALADKFQSRAYLVVEDDYELKVGLEP